MKYKYGRKSRERLLTVDRRLSYVFEKALESSLIDISILKGVRGKAEQNKAFKDGKSKLKWSFSLHNVRGKKLALAIDAAPYVNGKVSFDYNSCCFLAGIILGISKQFNYDVRWGGNWDMDGEIITDQDFQDLLHYELII